MKVFVLHSFEKDIVFKSLDEAIEATPFENSMADGDWFSITCKEMSEEQFEELPEW